VTAITFTVGGDFDLDIRPYLTEVYQGPPLEPEIMQTHQAWFLD
jgi:hypothetical protein